MFAADAHLDGRTRSAALFGGNTHKLADACLVQLREGVAFKDAGLVVVLEELARVVAREAVGHLREVVGAEGEELRLGGDGVGRQRRARDLDHRADLVGELGVPLGDDAVGCFGHGLLDAFKLLHVADERDHNLRLGGNPLGGDVERRFDDRGGLHHGNLGVGDGQTAAAVAHHRVELVQRGDGRLQLGDGQAHLGGQRPDVVLLGRQELVQRRVKEADGHRQPAHRAEDALEVLPLHRQQLGQRRLALLDRLGDDHLAHRGDAVGFEKHMLRPAESDALRAEGDRLPRVLGRVGVGAYAQGALFVRPFHERLEVARNGRGRRGDLPDVDAARRAVDGQLVALADGLAGDGEVLLLLVDEDVSAARHAAAAHTARDDGRVRRAAAAHGEDALGGVHALDVLGRGLQPHEDGFFAALGGRLGVGGGEANHARRGARRGGQPARSRLRGRKRLGVELRVQQRVELLRLDLQQRLVGREQALGDEIDGDFQRGRGRALAVAGLEHIELAVFNRKLHVLHIPVMLFQRGGDLGEARIHLGHHLAQRGNRLRRADAGDHVLALRVHQKLAVETVFAGGRVARERHARAARFAHVAEHHRLHVDRGSPA